LNTWPTELPAGDSMQQKIEQRNRPAQTGLCGTGGCASIAFAIFEVFTDIFYFDWRPLCLN
jgi:hypothetical protein